MTPQLGHPHGGERVAAPRASPRIPRPHHNTARPPSWPEVPDLRGLPWAWRGPSPTKSSSGMSLLLLYTGLPVRCQGLRGGGTENRTETRPRHAPSLGWAGMRKPEVLQAQGVRVWGVGGWDRGLLLASLQGVLSA